MYLETLNEIVRKIYAAANGQECWDDVVVEIGDKLDLGVIHLFLANLDSGVSYFGSSPRGNPELDQKYQEEYSALDFRVPRIRAQKPGVMFDEYSIATADEIQKSPLHQELFVRNDIFRIIGSNMSVDDAFGWFGVTTREASGDFTTLQRQALIYLSAHVLQAFDIAKTRVDLQIVNEAAMDVLGSAKVGMVHIENGHVTGWNDIAEAIFKQGFLKLTGGRLCCKEKLSNDLLTSHQNSPVKIANGPLRLVDQERGLEYFLSIKPVTSFHKLMPANESKREILLIKVIDRAQTPDLETINRFGASYRLSAAQVSAVHAVLTNTSLFELAEVRGVKIDTIRKQLKMAMDKLDVRSQKELVKLFERTIFFT